MDPKHYLYFHDSLLGGGCVYCGAASETRDHVPSKIFLDDPLPANLPIVEACWKYNNGFSSDEEYLACFLEATISGSTEQTALSREKVKKALARNITLAKRIQACCKKGDNGMLNWLPEYDRVQKIITKLARGHAALELSLTHFDNPDVIYIKSFVAMNQAECDAFENTGDEEPHFWPELGSRAFLRACGADPYTEDCSPWIDIQPGRYRYSVNQNYGSTSVKMVLSEYLTCEVSWL